MITDTKHTIIERIEGGRLTLQLNEDSQHNPFSKEMQRAVARRLRTINDEPHISVVIITGGEERSFSVGGDFKQVREFKGGEEVDEWIEDILDMYITCLEVDKPVIAALDHYTIGIGFQLALCCDWRIATTRTQLIMPELKHGIACILGQYMLEKMLGRAAMQHIVFDCDPVSLSDCLHSRLLDKVVAPEDMAEELEQMAIRLSNYPEVAYRRTKKEMNRTFVQGLRDICPIAQDVHRAAFRDKSAQRFMNSILNKH